MAYADRGYNEDKKAAMFCAVDPNKEDCDNFLSNYPANLGWAVRDANLYYNFRSGCPALSKKKEICADPRFINEPALTVTAETMMDPVDFRLSYNSPAIGAGVFIEGLSKDIVGVDRPNPPSLGAYEHTKDDRPVSNPSKDGVLEAGLWMRFLAWMREIADSASLHDQRLGSFPSSEH